MDETRCARPGNSADVSLHKLLSGLWFTEHAQIRCWSNHRVL